VKQASDGYVAMVQHYFASAWLLRRHAARQLRPQGRPQPVRRGHDHAAGRDRPRRPPDRGRAPVRRPAGGDHAGKGHAGPGAGQGLWLVHHPAKPLYWLLDQIHKVLGNWGWSIVALVVLLKIAFYWLNAKAYASMAKMKAINPKIRKCASA
jgi:YidC/Oxa1 family membrane protein insertase